MKNLMKKFLLADFCWQFGDALFLIVVNWYILDAFQKSGYVSTFYLVSTIAGIIISIVYWGYFIKKDSRGIIVNLNISMICMILGSLMIITICGANLFSIYVLAVCNGIGWNLYFPVSKILLGEIAREGEILEGNSFSETAMQGGTLVSSMIGGVLYKIAGFGSTMMLIVVMYVISTFFIRRISIYKANNSDEQINIVNGWDVRILFQSFAMSVPFIASICINASLAGYVRNCLGGNEICYGIFNTMFAVGACLAGFYTMSRFAKDRKGIAITMSFLFTILSGFALYLKVNVFLSGTVIFLMGLFGPSIRIFLYTELMQTIKGEALGMLLSIFNIVGLGIQTLISLVLSYQVDMAGDNIGFLYYSGVMALGAICFVASHKGNVINDRVEME